MTPNTTDLHAPPLDDLRALEQGEAHAHARRADGRLSSDELRSSGSGIAHMMLQLTTTSASPVPVAKGVGGRRSPAPASSLGGGYQDNCTVFEFGSGVKKIGADPRLDELGAMGLPEYWLQVAEYLGIDAFLGMWRILDANRHQMPQTKGNAGNSMAPHLRPYAGYLRFQKNRFVENLATQGVPAKEIQSRVQSQLCENISLTHISRLTQKNKLKR